MFKLDLDKVKHNRSSQKCDYRGRVEEYSRTGVGNMRLAENVWCTPAAWELETSDSTSDRSMLCTVNLVSTGSCFSQPEKLSSSGFVETPSEFMGLWPRLGEDICLPSLPLGPDRWSFAVTDAYSDQQILGHLFAFSSAQFDRVVTWKKCPGFSKVPMKVSTAEMFFPWLLRHQSSPYRVFLSPRTCFLLWQALSAVSKIKIKIKIPVLIKRTIFR